MALHYRIEGPPDAPVLLLAGSLGTTLEMWEPQLTSLADRLRLIAVDHRGHGGSPVPLGPYTIGDLGVDVLALLDHLGLERVSFCGLSIGGMVGIWLASHAAARLDRLALICTSAHMPPPSSWRERAAAVRGAGTPAAVADQVVERWFTPAFASAHPDVVARHRAMIASTPAEGYARCCEALAELDLRADLRRISAPTIVIAGAQDPATPPEHGRALADEIADARLELLDPAAHLASVERAQAVNALLVEHLRAGT